MKRIICYGASNTFGYDPRSPLGRAYPGRWTSLLGEYGFDAVNLGLPGRKIPAGRTYLDAAYRSISSQLPADMLLVMLGANDILAGASPEESAALMEEFLRECSLCDITAVIGEPGIHTGRRDDEKRLEEYGILLKDICSRCGAYYIDTSAWNISMGADGIHLDEASQEVFARELASFILKLQEE